jgi:hypothetical protein
VESGDYTVPARLVPVRLIQGNNAFLLEEYYGDLTRGGGSPGGGGQQQQQKGQGQKQGDGQQQQQQQQSMTRLKITTRDGMTMEIDVPGEIQSIEAQQQGQGGQQGGGDQGGQQGGGQGGQ